MRSIGRFLLVIGAFALLAAGCKNGDEGFRSTDITGAQFGRDFTLTDHKGVRRSLADFKGKVVVVFFGYTHCPDVCPTTLAELAAAMRQLGTEADKVQVLLVTVDPERDTPDVLGPYVSAFDPRFLALRGDSAETQAVTREFKVIYQKVSGKVAENYTMDHSAGTYIFDPEGRIRLYVSYGQGSQTFAHDIGRLLAARP